MILPQFPKKQNFNKQFLVSLNHVNNRHSIQQKRGFQ
jgi:hypothetical protein